MDRINGADTTDIGGGKRGFRSENLVAGVAGTEVTDLFLNGVQEEILKVVTEAGLVPDGADWSQLWQALKIMGLSSGSKNRRWTAVTSMSIIAPPANPAAGDTYLVPPGATGAWATNVGRIAEWTSTGLTGWSYINPPDGHGIGLQDGRVFTRIAGEYVEWESRFFTTSKLSRLPWLPVISMTLSSAPGAPTRGDAYLVPTGATGIWAAGVGKIAEWTGTAWSYVTPPDGHGISLPDGRIFERVSGTYSEKIAQVAQSGKWSFAVASGTVNALTVQLSPVPVSLATLVGSQIRVQTGTGNTAAATLDVNGFGAQPIRYTDGSELEVGETATRIITIQWNGTFFELTNPLLMSRRDLARTSALGLNLLTNPEFSHFRRISGGTGFGAQVFSNGTWAANAYYLDRWKTGAGGLTLSMNGELMTLSSAGTLSQTIEAPSIPGLDVTVSADVTSGLLDVTVAGVTVTLAAVSGRRSFASLTIPAGSTGDIIVTLARNGAADVTFKRPQLELGKIPSPYRSRGPVWESMLCDRYCQRHQFRRVSTANAPNWFDSLNLTYRQIMRAVPTLNWNLSENTNVTGYSGTYVTVQGAQFGYQSIAAGPMVVAGHILLEGDF